MCVSGHRVTQGVIAGTSYRHAGMGSCLQVPALGASESWASLLPSMVPRCLCASEGQVSA